VATREVTSAERKRRLARLFVGGTEGNARLTATTAAALIVLLAVEGATILSIRSLLSVHLFVGVLLIPVVGLKLASTGYRFLRYYAGNLEYRLLGPPQAVMRFLVAPFVVASTTALFATGVALLVAGPSGGGRLLQLHKASFVVWVGALGLHVLVYALRAARLLRADWGGEQTPGRVLRSGVLAGALISGLILALAALPLDDSWLDSMR
jgi:hypothetical protein